MNKNTYLRKAPESNDIAPLIEEYKELPGGLLPLLHRIQELAGYIPSESIQAIATALNLSQAEVYGVITFYDVFSLERKGKHKLQICRAEACQANGSRDLEVYAQKKLATSFHQTTADREISLEPVYCLGNCACGPSIRINDEIYGRVSTQRFDELIDQTIQQKVKLV